MEPFIKFFRMPRETSHLYIHIKFSPDKMYYLYFMSDGKKNSDWVRYFKDVNQIENHIPISYLDAEQWLYDHNYITFLYSKIAEILSKQKDSYEVRNKDYYYCFSLPSDLLKSNYLGISIKDTIVINLASMHSISIQRRSSIFKPVFDDAQHMRDCDMQQYEVKRDEEIMDSFNKPLKEWNKDIKEEFMIPKKQTKTKQPLNIKFSNFKIK